MFRSAFAVLAAALLGSVPCFAARSSDSPAVPGRHLVPSQRPAMLTSSSTGVRFKASAGPDTFCLYGGPNNPAEGKFQTAGGAPGTLGHAPHAIVAAEWFGVDLTDKPAFWQVSDFCAETLDGTGGPGHGPGNLAWWAGRSATQEPGWATAPGYGNNWSAALEWRTTMADPSVGQTVGLSFAFHHDSEPSYDFFGVEYDSASTTRIVYSVDGSNAPFAAPGLQYPEDVVARAIVYAPFGYPSTGPDSEMRLRLAFWSDGAWSDEDGMWPTTCGGAIVDDIEVTWTDGVEQHSDFSDVDVTNSWSPVHEPYVGDFSWIVPLFQDIDPCRENPTPAVGFIDDGRCPTNETNNSGQSPCQSTGGTTMFANPYGVSGGWAVNFTGGLAPGLRNLFSEVWSPLIAWDLPGTEDDDVEIAGARLRFSVWSDLNLFGGIYWVWHVRTSHDGGATWSDFADDSFVHYGDPQWQCLEVDVTRHVGLGGPPTHVQIALGVVQPYLQFVFPDPTPSPVFDNVALLKYRVEGPVITARDIDLYMDAFPQSGQADFTTLAGRQNADVKLGIRDVSTGALNIPGDSMVVDVTSVIPGADVASVELEWILDKNPWFDDVRTMPVGTTVVAGGAFNGWDQWTSKVAGQPITVAGELVVPLRYSFDLPDQDFFHPGDALRFLVRATDTDGRLTTLPRDTSAFATGFTGSGSHAGWYPRPFEVYALPTVVDEGQGLRQPPVLVVNATDIAATDGALTFALRQANLPRSAWFLDVYEVVASESRQSNGIGSAGAHGATPDQLAGYSTIVYLLGDRTLSLSDGSDQNGNDKSDDVGTLMAWFGQDDDRYLAHFGDHTVSALLQGSPGPGGTHVSTILGVQLHDADVSDEIQNQATPLVAPAWGSPWAVTRFVAFGGCPGRWTFDSIDAAPGAVRGHEFLNVSGEPYGGPYRSGSVIFAQLDANLNDKVAITFPYGLASIWDESEPDPDPIHDRAKVLDEVLNGLFVLQLPIIDPPVGADAVRRPLPLRVHPNPANPATTIRFGLARSEHVDLHVYDLRGARVATVFSGELDAGPQEFVWRGQDHRGATVASGVYFVECTTEDHTQTAKVLILK